MLGFQTHAGQNWHSHAHHEGRARGEGPAADGVDRYGNAVSDVVALPDHQPDLGLVRTLIYPEGFKARGDGGLKIVPEKCWDDNAWKYLPRTDGQKATECNFRTAAEDVMHVPEIKAFFPEM